MGFKPYDGEVIPIAEQPWELPRANKVNPELAGRFGELAKDYYAETGMPLRVTDSFRSNAEQVDLYRRKPKLAAPPGKSRHEYGDALDIDQEQIAAYGTDKWSALLNKHGFVRPALSKGETWHIELPRFEKAGAIAGPSGKAIPYDGEILPLNEPQGKMVPYDGEVLPLEATPGPAATQQFPSDVVKSAPSLFARAADFIDKNLIQQPGSAEEAAATGFTGEMAPLELPMIPGTGPQLKAGRQFNTVVPKRDIIATENQAFNRDPLLHPLPPTPQEAMAGAKVAQEQKLKFNLDRPQDISKTDIAGAFQPQPLEESPAVSTAFIRGLKHGTAQVGETAGTLTEIAGQVSGSDVLKQAGKRGEQVWESVAKKWEIPKGHGIEGTYWDDPKQLLNTAKLAYSVGETIPSFVAAAAPVAVTMGVGGVTATMTRAALVGQLIGGGVGGSMEGASTYKEILQRGGTQKQALMAATMMALASGGLNAVSFGQMFSPVQKGLLKRFILTGTTEAVTEYAEEPAEALIKRGIIPKAFSEEDINKQLREGLEVIPASFLLGGTGGAGFSGAMKKEQGKAGAPAAPGSQPTIESPQAAPTQSVEPVTVTEAIPRVPPIRGVEPPVAPVAELSPEVAVSPAVEPNVVSAAPEATTPTVYRDGNKWWRVEGVDRKFSSEKAAQRAAGVITKNQGVTTEIAPAPTLASPEIVQPAASDEVAPAYVIDGEGKIAKVLRWDNETPIITYPGKEGGIRGQMPYEYKLDSDWREASGFDFQKAIKPTGSGAMRDLRRWQEDFSSRAQEEPRPYPLTGADRRREVLENRIKRGESVPGKLLVEFPDLAAQYAKSTPALTPTPTEIFQPVASQEVAPKSQAGRGVGVLDKPISSNRNNIRDWLEEPSDYQSKKLTYRQVAEKMVKDKDIELRKETYALDPSRPLGESGERYVAYYDGKKLREFPKEFGEYYESMYTPTLPPESPGVAEAGDPIDTLIAQYKATGRTATRYPKKKAISVDGRTMTEKAAVLKMKEEAGKADPLQAAKDFKKKFGSRQGTPDVGIVPQQTQEEWAAGQKTKKPRTYDIQKALDEGDIITVVRFHGRFDSQSSEIKDVTSPEERKYLLPFVVSKKTNPDAVGIDVYFADLKASYPGAFDQFESSADFVRFLVDKSARKDLKFKSLEEEISDHDAAIEQQAAKDAVPPDDLTEAERIAEAEVIAAERAGRTESGKGLDLNDAWWTGGEPGVIVPKAKPKTSLETRLDALQESYPDLDAKNLELVLKTFPDGPTDQIVRMAKDPKVFDQLRRQRLQKMSDSGGDADQMQALPGFGGLFGEPGKGEKRGPSGEVDVEREILAERDAIAQEHPEVEGHEEKLKYLFSGAGPTPDTIKLFKKIAKNLEKNPYFKDLSKDDISLLGLYFELPYWRSLENPEFKRVYDGQKEREYTRNTLNDEILSTIEPHMRWAKSMPRVKFEKLSAALHDLVGPVGKVDPTDAQLKEIGFNDEGIQGLRQIWSTFDHIADVRIPALMKEFGAPQNVIDEMRGEMGRLKRFMPHYRAGKYNIMAIGGNKWETRSRKDGSPVIYKSETTAKSTVTFLNNKYPSAQARAVETPDGWTLEYKPPKKVEHYEMFDDILSTLVGGEHSPKVATKGSELQKRYPGSKITSTEVRRLPEEAFWHVDTKNMMAVINEAADSAKVSDKEAVKQALLNAVVKTLQTRGFGSHFQKRKGIPGYDKTDYIRDAVQFIQSFNGFETKIKAAIDFTKALSKIDQKSQGWQYASKYVRDMLANSESMDRVSDKLRAGFFMYFLGGVARQIVLQPTQNFIAFVPAIQQYTKWSSPKIASEMALASKDVLVNIGSRIAGKKPEALESRLSPAESAGMESSRKKGILADQLTREYGTYLLSTMGWVGRALMNASMFFIGNAEKFNRHTAWLVSYRVATKELKYDHQKAVQFAEQMVEMAHFVYGKANLPPIFRGGKAEKLLRSSYAFRSYNANLMRLYAHLGTGGTGKISKAFSGDSRSSQLGVLKGLLSLLTFGGLSGLLGYKWLEEKIQTRTGKNVRTEIKRNLGKLGDLVNHGLLASAGIDLSGSLGMESPKSIGEIIGVPWALGSIPASAIDFYKKGDTYRAMETLAPSVVKGPMKAVRWYQEGVLTKSGKSVKDVSGSTERFTPYEAGVKALSFRTVKEADMQRRREAIQNIKKSSLETRTNLLDAYRIAFKRYGGGSKEVEAIKEQHHQFNQELNRLEIKFIPKITAESRFNARTGKENKYQRRERQAFP